jgi:hypothetical protein
MEYAYDSQDLDANLVTGEPGYPGICNVDNDIHPMWRIEKFRVGNINEEVRMLRSNDDSWDRSTPLLDPKLYERMLPGLRLASLLLGQSGSFFSQLLRGRRNAFHVRRLQPMGDYDDWRIRPLDVIGDPHEPPYVVAAELEAFANHVADKWLIYIPGEDSSVTGAWGETQTTFNERCRYAVGLGSVLTDVMCEPQWQKQSAQSRRYYNFQLAITLVQELAHVVWRARRWDELLHDPECESEDAILSPNEEQVELGQAWENWCFGGELRLIETYEEPARWFGYAFCPFSIDSGYQRSVGYPDTRFSTHAIPAFCIYQFFQKERWAAHWDGSLPFTIQQTPLTSLTTEVWQPDNGHGFMARMDLNHEYQTHPRSPFLQEQW